jgi:cytochrome c peroxidase
MKRLFLVTAGVLYLAAIVAAGRGDGAHDDAASRDGAKRDPIAKGRRLFERETFAGNGRTCQTCHTAETGTVSPEDAGRRFRKDPDDPLFRHDGSDDGLGQGVQRMLTDATVLVTVPLAANVTLADDPEARTVTLRRAIPSTLNTPALDPVLMLDGRQPDLESQAIGAILDHAQGGIPTFAEAHALAEFQKTRGFFSSQDLWSFSRGGPAPGLPQGRTASERRGRRFFEDLPPNPADGLKSGLCAHCHSGPLLNTTNEFAAPFIPSPAPVPAGQRFISVGVSEFNTAGNPVRVFVFNAGTPAEVRLTSPDPGRALVTGIVDDPTLEHVNAFKISPLRGIRRTAPYFHDNSAKTLADVAAHYATFFRVASGGLILLTPQDEKDIVAYMKLLD